MGSTKNLYFCLVSLLMSAKMLRIFWVWGIFGLFFQVQSQDLSFLLEQTIQRNFSVRLAHTQVARQQGLWQQQKGQFNWIGGFTANVATAQIPLSAYDQEVLSLQQALFKTNGLFYQATSRKQFITGQEILMSVGVQYQSFSYLPENGYRGDIRFTLVQPLLQGSGKKSAYANTAAQHASLKTAEFKLKAEVAYRVYQTLGSYIRWLTLKTQAEITHESQKRHEHLLTDIQELAESGKVRQADVLPTQAGLANQQRKKLEIEAKLNEAFTQLALSAGVKLSEIQDTQSLSQINVPKFTQTHPLAAYLNFAVHNRFDLKLIDNQIAAYNFLAAQARQLSLPKLDLTGSVGLTGQAFRLQGEPFAGRYLVQPLYASPIGPNFMAGISLSFPPQKDYAKGKLLETKSLLEQAQTEQDYLSHTLEANILLYLKNLELTYQSWEKARETVAYYKQIIENEQIKLTLEKSTILDLLYAQNTLTEALMEEVQAKASYLLTIAGLRYECGMIVYFMDNEAVLYPKLLTELPTLPDE